MHLKNASTALRLASGLWLLAAGLSFAHAQDEAPASVSVAAPAPAATLKALALGRVKATPAILASAAGQNSKSSIDRMSQALDGQLIAAVQQTRKFNVLARSDRDALEEETQAGENNLNAEHKASKSDFTLVVTIDDFQDFTQTATFASIGKTATKRVIRFATVAKLYETQGGKLIETANFQEQNLDTEEELANSSSSGGELSDALLLALTRRMSEKIAQRIADVAYPARILAKTGKIVTINRGDGTGIATGQLWEVFALGEDLIDPDTGASLGREEMSVGKVRIQRVTPRTAQGEITGEDLGIDRGAIVRRVEK